MGFFDVTEEKLKILYHRAWGESGYSFVDPRKYPYLNQALMQYARENHCTYDRPGLDAGKNRQIENGGEQNGNNVFCSRKYRR